MDGDSAEEAQQLGEFCPIASVDVERSFCIINQSLICGKGVGLGLFPFDSLQSQHHTHLLKLHT